MQIFLISQYENIGPDTHKSAVVVAPHHSIARTLDPQTGLVIQDWNQPHWASRPERVIVQHIGTAADGVHPGLILSHVRGH